MRFIDHIRELGLVFQASAELESHLDSGARTVYCGFDPTADSLHIGNLVPLLALRRFQMAGHRPILLVGGATGLIGDPGGRSAERELQPREMVAESVEKIRAQASGFLDFDDGDSGAIVVNNIEWTSDLSVIDYLRDIGKHFSVNAMMQKESVKRRIEDPEQGISYAEFSYMLLQSYDFVMLNRRHDCTIQMGGSDQWGNITAGIDLIRRMEGRAAHGLTYPLIAKADGTKFGKSSGGAIWLDAAQTSPYGFYQFWRNAADDDVMRFIRLFTFLDADEIAGLQQAHDSDPGSRVAHVELARQVTKLVHGETGLAAAERITDALFTGKLAELGAADLAQLALDGMDATKMNAPTLAQALVDSGLAVTPRGEVTAGQARKLIQGGGVSVNGVKATDEDLRLDGSSALHGKYFIVRKGKKHHHLVIVGDD